MLEEKVKSLERVVVGHAPLIVAYSGGVDSTCLLAVAHRSLGDRVLGVIADSPSLPREALADAMRVAGAFCATVEVVKTQEFENPQYSSNPLNRCYFCKAELFSRLDAIARARGFAAIAYGENADDPSHLRPGSKAAAEFAVIAPLRQAGLTKADVRALSRRLGLPTADAPAQPCLSSRIPHHTPVTREVIALVEKGEMWVRSLGFKVFRVRYVPGQGEPSARVQIAPEEMSALRELGGLLERGLQEAGFRSVFIDPDGYRAGMV